LMFPSPETGTYRDQNAVTRKFKRMLRRAGLPESTRFHDLRHTCATIALEEGVEIKALSSMLGHSDVAFTMNTYVHATKKLKTSAADKMEAAFEIGYSTVMNAQCGLKEA
ncbi:MAG: tyrosine-type recombinase/integrase, partial [Eubacterium sp.]|nr:tyrosine-type recombinase/integrase [Eubacterium sp.]